jgi:hypothetical protein
MAFLFPDVVDGTDVGVAQGGSCLSLPLKTRECLRVAGNLFRKKLEGNESAQARVFGLVDDAHPASADFLYDAVMRNGLADHGIA